MPLDMTCVLTDPLLSDTFSVKRYAEAVGANGRVQKMQQLFSGLRGVVVAQDAKLDRRDDSQSVPTKILVSCAFALRDARTGFQPDVVVWNGVEYLVTESASHQRVAGFTKAACSSTSATEAPQ